MLKKLFKDSFIYSISTFLSKGIGIIMIPLYTRILSPKEYGIIELITLFGTILAIFLNLEIHQAVARHYPDAETAFEKKKIVSTAFWFILTTYALFNVIALFFYPQLAALVLNEHGHTRLFSLAVWTLTCNFIFYFLQSQLIWQLRSRQNAISAIVYTIITASLTVTFLYELKWGVAAVFMAQLVAACAGICLSFFFARESFGYVFDTKILKKLVIFSLPLVPSTLAVYGMLYVDRYIINCFLSLDEVGLYSIAFKLASTIGLMTASVQTALTPLIYTHYQEPETPAKIAVLFRYFLLIGLTAITALSIFAPELMKFFTQPAYYKAAQLVPFLLMSVYFSGILNFSPGVFVKNRTILIVYINLAMFAANVLLNILLVKAFGVVGAAFATMLSSLLYFGLYQAIGNRMYRIPHSWPSLIGSFCCCCGAILFISMIHMENTVVKCLILILTFISMFAMLSNSKEWKYCFQLVRGETT